MNTITEMERRKAELRAAMKAEDERHTKVVHGLKDEYRLAEERIQLSAGGLDEAKIDHAEHVLYVMGSYADAGSERAVAMENAKAAILAGGGTLFQEYQGTKSYDRWHGQWIACDYGYGPKHGSVIFSIGLTDATRKREPKKLDDQEIESCLYYLNNLERIQAAKATARKAA